MKLRTTRFLIAFLLPATFMFGQEVANPGSWTENTYGIADEAVLVLDAWAFQPSGSDVTWVWTSSGRYLTISALWTTPFQLPTGAIITTVELEGCDWEAASDLSLTVMRRLPAPPGGTGSLQQIAALASSGSAGCLRWSSPASSAFGAIDNTGHSYYVNVAQGSYNGLLQLTAVRIYYVLQVSPAPQTATFADVPVGSALHQYVEALAAAGITGGCGGGNFCPNSPVTRGQIAVFLAKALGLHWAP